MKSNKQKNEIPDGWNVKKLGTLFDIKRGGSPRPINEYITDDEDGLNWLKIGDIDRNEKYINYTSSKIIKEGLNKTTLVKKGDFILSNSMSFGRPYILNIDTCIHDGWLTFQNIKIDILDRDFLYFLLLHPRTQNKFKVISAGSGVQNLKKETVSEVSLLFPPLVEQKRIVGVLEVWDFAVEKLERKIVIKENIKKGIASQIMNCNLIVNDKLLIINDKNKCVPKLRLPGFDGGWEEKKLEKICEINPKILNLPKEFIYIDLESVVKGVLVKKNKIQKNDAPSRAQRYLKSNDIIFQTVRPYQKNNLFFNFGEGYVASTGYAQIRAKYSSMYLYQYLNTQKFVNSVLTRCTGSNYPAINSTDLAKIKVIFPKLKEQKAIAEVLTTADEEIEVLRKKLGILKDQKKFLLNNLVTGDIIVND